MHPKVFRGDRLRAARESHGWSLQDLSERTQINKSQLHRYEMGQAEPLPHQITRLAKEFGFTTDWFLGLVDEPAEHLSELNLTQDERKFLEALRGGNLRTLLSLIQQTVPDKQEQPDITGVDVAADSQPLNRVK